MEVHLSKLREMAKAREGWRAAVHGVTGSDTTEQPNNNKKQEPRWWQRDPRREEQKAEWVLAAERRGVRLGQGDWRASGRSMPPFLGGRGPWSQAKDESQPRGLPLSYIPAKEHSAQCAVVHMGVWALSVEGLIQIGCGACP